MLFITIKLNDYSPFFDKKWHIGEPFPVSYRDIEKVVELQADGNELHHLMRKFKTPDATGLFSKLTVQRWFGDEAKRLTSMIEQST